MFGAPIKKAFSLVKSAYQADGEEESQVGGELNHFALAVRYGDGVEVKALISLYRVGCWVQGSDKAHAMPGDSCSSMGN